MAEKNLLIYTLGMKRMYLAEAANVPQNIEAFLNAKGPDAELILSNVEGYHNFDGQGYRPNTPISEIGIKCGHIDLIVGTKEIESLIYNNSQVPRISSEVSVRFGIVPFSYGLVGELKFPASHIPDNRGRLEYITRRLEMQKFISLYNPRQPENPARSDKNNDEFVNLFKETQFDGNIPKKILLNRTVHTVNSKAIWVPYEERE